jgi:type II secretory pathway component PulL
LKEFDQSGSQVTKFKALHLNFLETNRFKNSNYFKRSFSLKYLKFKFKISSLESWAISASLLLLLVVPFLISSTINSSAKDYQGKTIQIFQQLNPNFNRLVNARAQIDDLTRDIPRQNSFSNQDLGMLQYLEQLNDSSVKKIKIDLQAGSIAISLEGLPTYKLELLQQLFQSEPLTFEVSGLVEKDKAMFGKLLVSYES